MGSKRGDADRLPLGRFAVPDPDDEGRMTYWRVEADGKHRVLRPWPHDVRWAPWRPDYPEGLNPEQRRAWSQQWYQDVYFGWKEAVIDAIAADPQGAADEFARSAPDAELPEPVKKRPRVRAPRPRVMSAKQRRMAAEALMAEALARAGMSERGIAEQLSMARTTVQRRLARPARVADEVSQLLLEAQLATLLEQVRQLREVTGPRDTEQLRDMVGRIQELQARAAGLRDVDARVGGSVSGGLSGGDVA